MSNKNTSTAIATLFSGEITEQGLADLRERFPKEVVHDMTVDAEFKAGRKVRTELNKLTKAIKERRLSVTGEIKTKADDLTNEVELIFATVVGPFETQLEVNKLAKEKEERELKELLDGQRVKINELNNFVSDCVGKTSQSISEVIEAVDLIDTTYFHKDIIHEAIETKTSVQSRLAELLTQALNEESLQVERDKLAKQQEEADKAQRIADLKAQAQTRLNNLMMIPTGFFGKTSKEINDKIESLTNYEVLEAEFCELFNQANAAKTQVISQLAIMSGQQKTAEEVAELAEAEDKNRLVKFQELEKEAGLSQCEQEALANEMQGELDGTNQSLMAETIANAAPTLSELGGVQVESALTKTRNLLKQIMGNYQVAASIAGQEGYETNYDQDKILVDFLLND